MGKEKQQTRSAVFDCFRSVTTLGLRMRGRSKIAKVVGQCLSSNEALARKGCLTWAHMFASLRRAR